MRIDSVSGLPSEVERPATTGAVTAAATEVNVHSNEPVAPVPPVLQAEKIVQAASNGRGETVWLQDGKRQVFRVIDEKTGDILCQVPSDEVLRVSRNLEDLVESEEKKLDVKS